ncbi:methyl-accepting chemotaxis protein [Aliamphritea ceti]|uniref:methyl-accepting chemotaxis protein n=1 Tax=Aliamphritea ceti TaxID=1524258 RepID=UPI0021C49A7B|nr:methyl-accepting chemotaxis protein [Aliamphritea ceti]
MSINSWPLTRQLSLGVFVLVGVIMAVLIGVVGYESRAVLIAQAEQSQDRQVEVLASQLDTAYGTIIDNTERLASTFKGLYPDALVFDRQKTVQVGDYASPLVTHNGEVVNLDFTQVDKFARMTGGNATVFIRYKDDFLRVTTSLKNLQGKRAIGTLLGKGHPGFQQLMRGEVYLGEARLFGTDYMTKYTPVMNSGNVVAILYVGFPTSDLLKQLRNNLLMTRFGDSGHAGLVYNSQSKLAGKLIADQRSQGEALSVAYSNAFFSDVVGNGSGAFEYTDVDHSEGVRVSYRQAGSSPWTVFAISFKEEYSRQIQPLLWLLVVMAVAAVAVLVILLSLFLRRSLGPLKEVGRVLELAGQGDLTAGFKNRPDAQSENELTRLQLRVARMLEEFSTVIARVRASGDDVATVSSEIYVGSDQLQEAAQASSEEIVQVSAAITQVADSIHHVAENVSSVSAEADTTSQLALDGKQAVAEVEQTINLLNTEFAEVVGSISKLEQDSADIGSVVEVINAVAEQTNLLALNAAIEAARAGEQGRGFAVVADEVRTLARRVQDSTKEIQQVVAKLQLNAKQASERMRAGESRVFESVERAELAEGLLSQIQAATQRVRERMMDVASATEEQSCASEQISQSSQSLQERSRLAAERAHASSEASQAMQLSAQALQGQVSQFKI